MSAICIMEVPDERAGYRVFTFVAQGLEWRVTKCPANGDQPERTLLSSSGDSVWPSSHILSLDGAVSPLACAEFIARAYMIASKAHGQGYAKRGADIREALGVGR